MNVRFERYRDVTGHLREKIEAKNTSPKIGLFSQQNPIFVPQKQGHNNIQNKFQKLFLSLKLKTIWKIVFGGLPCKIDDSSDGGGSRLPTVVHGDFSSFFFLGCSRSFPFSLLPASLPFFLSFLFSFSFTFSFLSFPFFFSLCFLTQNSKWPLFSLSPLNCCPLWLLQAKRHLTKSH